MEKDRAIQVFNNYQQKAIVCARREEIEDMSPQYEPLVTVIEMKEEDFAPVGGGNFYPQKSLQNRMADAAGIKFTENCGTRSVGTWVKVSVHAIEGGLFEAVGEYAVIGFAQGYRLGPDGQPRTSSVCEYEFNIVDRCNMESFMGKNPPRTLIEARKKLLEFKKFSVRRASTGAQLAVIRELTGIPTAFKKEDTIKPLLLAQVVESNSFKMGVAKQLMQTPDGRQAVAGAMFGNTRQIFGPSTPAPAIPESGSMEKVVYPADDFDEPVSPAGGFSDDFDDEPTNDPRRDLIIQLEQYQNSELPEKAKARITDMIKNANQYTDEQIEEYLTLCKKKLGGAA